MSEDPFERACQIRRGELDDEMPKLDALTSDEKSKTPATDEVLRGRGTHRGVMDTDPLKPCPFCGQEESVLLWIDAYKDFLVRCGTCGCRGPHDSDRGMAIDRWNNRFSAAVER